jgi:hypothetical protein
MDKYRPCLRICCLIWVGLGACQSGPAAKTPPPATAAKVPVAEAATPATEADSIRELARFVPSGYRVEAVSKGDLNRDAFLDQVVLLRQLEVDTTVAGDEATRPLLLLLGTATHTYTLAARNDNAVLCTGCGGMMGDPFQGIAIKKGYFSLEYYGGSAWRWTHVTTFRYDPAQRTWFLSREGGGSFHATEPEKLTTHVRTGSDFGRVAFRDYRYETSAAE